jgi:hypothetical protein
MLEPQFQLLPVKAVVRVLVVTVQLLVVLEARVLAAVCLLSVALARPAQAEVSTSDPQTVGLPARAAA